MSLVSRCGGIEFKKDCSNVLTMQLLKLQEQVNPEQDLQLSQKKFDP